jgi:phosphoglycolate phosphatase
VPGTKFNQIPAVRDKMKFSGVLFDLDGTLLNTLDDIAESMNSVLEKHGLPQHPVDTYRYFVGEGMEILVRKSLPAQVWADDFISILFDEMKYTYQKRWNLKTKPYDGIADVLMSIKRAGVHIGVLSNKIHEVTCETVRYYFNQVEFDTVIGHRDFRRKPSPEAAFFIAQQWGSSPEQILYVGDSMVDMQTATNASMVPAGVLWGFRDKKELLENGARYILKKPSDILAILK